MRLWTVQHHTVPAILETTGELAGDWAKIMVSSYAPAYREMVAEMARRGVDCAGRPPIWAWTGPDTRDADVVLTAELLLGPTTAEEYATYVILDLIVPDEIVVLSSYGRWNTYLDAILFGEGPPYMDWTIDPHEQDEPGRVQACLPVLKRSWVLNARPFEEWREPSVS
ncbi:DUF3841 domain-containing protein [Sinosporangium siamense]|uniref:Uncharacterized protein n=1 Tax=Sinosporangium siamense TaxID=1367973 RepID=A0A919V9F5_9ACTN|nr:DUF3841 domain-containing protein [Sinosporangium siamense]GII95388.1 hypothetical protein Ssi02_56190 [Sinosporangium siamense]